MIIEAKPIPVTIRITDGEEETEIVIDQTDFLNDMERLYKGAIDGIPEDQQDEAYIDYISKYLEEKGGKPVASSVSEQVAEGYVRLVEDIKKKRDAQLTSLTSTESPQASSPNETV